MDSSRVTEQLGVDGMRKIEEKLVTIQKLADLEQRQLQDTLKTDFQLTLNKMQSLANDATNTLSNEQYQLVFQTLKSVQLLISNTGWVYSKNFLDEGDFGAEFLFPVQALKGESNRCEDNFE
jgi:hypothetical protein